ncbi:hypothetical protein EJ08DRAFT_659399 [Tothia fuscella]|uniref:Uncharacterized protein n=1 Tax=Tothia fuscella TaxID=1048955 RepID=A0A9P4TZ33_9PEZI|nr:hypothetical protein EJ08DRAFT_659399 [Tothia fuscella]
MFPTIIQRNNLPSGMLFDFENNPFRAKKEWPPDFSKLSPKHQFRFERRYRRRAKLAWARPGWKKGTKLVQYGLSIFVLGYGVLYMDWGQDDSEHPPFASVRKWYRGFTDSIWTHSTTPLERDNVRRD